MVMVNNGAGRKYTFDIAKTPRADRSGVRCDCETKLTNSNWRVLRAAGRSPISILKFLHHRPWSHCDPPGDPSKMSDLLYNTRPRTTILQPTPKSFPQGGCQRLTGRDTKQPPRGFLKTMRDSMPRDLDSSKPAPFLKSTALSRAASSACRRRTLVTALPPGLERACCAHQ